MKIKYFLLFIVISVLSACSNKNKFEVDVSDIKVDIKIKRLDIDLFKFKPDSSMVYIKHLSEKYGNFLNLYSSQILKIGFPTESDYDQKLGKFLVYCTNEKIQETVKKSFQNLDTLQNELNLAFKHYKYYFPKKEIPKIYTCISAFNESVITDSAVIGISLDKYLGAHSEYYQRLEWDNYLKRKMIHAMIPVDVMRAWIQAEYPFSAASDNLLESMIYEGKIQYLLDAFLPSVADSLKWGCTEKQFKWAEKNQKNIWTYLVEQKKIFSTDKTDLRNYINDGPFTVPFSNVSMPRAGVIVGYKIIESYMVKRKNIDFEDLMNETNANIILADSRYNP